MAITTTERGIPTEVSEYLRLHHIITLSTASFTGMPHANTVAYANDDSCIYFRTSPSTQIARNIDDNHYVSFTIDDYTTDWRKVRELQGVGRCSLATDAEQAGSREDFTRKFGDRVVFPPGETFAVRPLEMHFVDYSYDLVPSHEGLEPEVTSRTFELGELADPPPRAAVATSLDRTAFEAGEVIFRPGDDTKQYYVVVEGQVEVRGEGFGADQTVTRVGPGQMFGDQAALYGQRGALTAHAVAPTVLLAVERGAIRDLLLPRD